MIAKLKVPSLPNFIHGDLAGQSITLPIASVPDEELAKLADEWKAKLLSTAAERRRAANLEDGPVQRG